MLEYRENKNLVGHMEITNRSQTQAYYKVGVSLFSLGSIVLNSILLSLTEVLLSLLKRNEYNLPFIVMYCISNIRDFHKHSMINSNAIMHF